MSIPALETEHLLLRPLAFADADAIQALFPQWEIVRFLNASIPWPYPPDGAATFLRDLVLPAHRDGRGWHWSLRKREAPEQLIGVISLQESEDDNRGFWIAPAWQGQGFASEANEAVTGYWFEILGKAVLRVSKAIANRASRRISERSGMRVIWRGERDYVGGRWPTEIWEITAEEWRRRSLGNAPAKQGADEPPASAGAASPNR